MATVPLTIPDARVNRTALGLGWDPAGSETALQCIRRRAIQLIINEVSQNEQVAKVRAVPPDPALGIT